MCIRDSSQSSRFIYKEEILVERFASNNKQVVVLRADFCGGVVYGTICRRHDEVYYAALIIGDLCYVVAGIMDDCLRSSGGGQSIVCELYFFAHDLPLLSKFIVPVLLICITLAPLLKKTAGALMI